MLLQTAFSTASRNGLGHWMSFVFDPLWKLSACTTWDTRTNLFSKTIQPGAVKLALTSLNAPELHASRDVREPTSLHQAVYPLPRPVKLQLNPENKNTTLQKCILWPLWSYVYPTSYASHFWQTYRQRQKQTDRDTNIQTETQTYRQRHKQADRLQYNLYPGQTDRQRRESVCFQTDRRRHSSLPKLTVKLANQTGTNHNRHKHYRAERHQRRWVMTSDKMAATHFLYWLGQRQHGPDCSSRVPYHWQHAALGWRQPGHITQWARCRHAWNGWTYGITTKLKKKKRQ